MTFLPGEENSSFCGEGKDERSNGKERQLRERGGEGEGGNGCVAGRVRGEGEGEAKGLFHPSSSSVFQAVNCLLSVRGIFSPRGGKRVLLLSPRLRRSPRRENLARGQQLRRREGSHPILLFLPGEYKQPFSSRCPSHQFRRGSTHA